MTRTGGMVVIGTNERQAWERAIDNCPAHDYYHLHGYHALAEQRGEGKARLFVYTDASYSVALPLLLRDLSTVAGLDGEGDHWLDATSVYGYCGPVSSHNDIPDEVRAGFRESLIAELRARNAVSVFSRLHPLLPQAPLLDGLGECPVLGQTISIDLTLPQDEQRAGYRKGNAYEIRRLQREGMVCVHDRELKYFDTFIELYRDTMLRVDAASYYLFDQAYFEALRDALGSGMHLFATLLGDDVTSAGLFVECGRILQYHLSGTAASFSKMASTKLLLDSVRDWASTRGIGVFHLGGGVGGNQDSLFFFKAGFSHRRHDFRVWRWIPDPDTYQRLCESRRVWQSLNNVPTAASGYFPEYRG